MAAELRNLTPASNLTLAIVGGAAGVGKSTLLDELANVSRFSTGTLFKKHMTLASRDDVRISDWSLYEDAVAQDLTDLVVSSLSNGEIAIIDTHFAAKLRGKLYRIGLKQQLLFNLGRAAFEYADSKGQSLSAKIVLINCGPHELLNRRRLDKSRNRELIPSDCYNGLRENKTLANQYLFELLRARGDSGNQHEVKHYVVENNDLQVAADELKKILRCE